MLGSTLKPRAMGRRGRPPKLKPVIQQGPVGTATFGTKSAARLVEKNARSLVKLLQLQELKRKAPNVADSANVQAASERIDMLKKRINRRLIKLARWADGPHKGRDTSAIDTGYLHALPSAKKRKMEKVEHEARGKAAVEAAKARQNA